MKTEADELTRDSRRWRTGLLLAWGFMVLAVLYTNFLCSPILPYCADAGFNGEYDAATASFSVSDVAKGGPAASAGLRTGDRIYFRQIAFRERLRLFAIRFGDGIPIGERLTFIAHRDSQQFTSVVMPLQRHATWPDLSTLIQAAIQLWGLLFAALLAGRRPDLVQARLLSLLCLLIFGVSNLVGTVVPWLAGLDFVIVMFGHAASLAAPTLVLALLSAQFARPLSARRQWMVALIATFAIVAFAEDVAVYVVRYLLAFPDTWLQDAQQYALAAGYAGALLCLVSAALATRTVARQRAIWATLSIAPYLIVLIVTDLWPTPNQASVNVEDAITSLAAISMPIGFTYAILNRRLLDIGFVVNRAAVVAALSAVAITVFVLLGWGVGILFPSLGRTGVLAINVGAALLLGVFAPALYRGIASGVERYLFRRQHRAREQVAVLAAGLPYAESASAIAETLTTGICASFDLPSGAVFRRAGSGAFIREAAIGWSGDEVLGPTDAERLAMSLQGTRSMLRLSRAHVGNASLPGGERAPSIVFPLFARQALIGFVLYSTHPGADLDPDELALLSDVAQQASRGYDAVELASRIESAYRAKVEAQTEVVETVRRSAAALERINEAQSRFVPSEFLHYLGKESIVDVALGDSVQRSMTILFSDIRSFTEISEGMSPPQIFAYLNRYLHRVEPVVSEHGGFIDKYIGDAVMGLFPKSADDALRAGIDLQREVRVLNRKLADEGLPNLAIGVGIHTGELMLGTIGGRNRMETTVIADAVNAASRLEGATKTFRCSIVLSRETRDALCEPERFMLRYLGTLQVKGKSEKLAVYEAFDADPAEIIVHKQNTAERFGEALAAFEAGDWARARARFSGITIDCALDGPATYYLERSQDRAL